MGWQGSWHVTALSEAGEQSGLPVGTYQLSVLLYLQGSGRVCIIFSSLFVSPIRFNILSIRYAMDDDQFEANDVATALEPKLRSRQRMGRAQTLKPKLLEYVMRYS